MKVPRPPLDFPSLTESQVLALPVRGRALFCCERSKLLTDPSYEPDASFDYLQNSHR